MKHFTQKKTTGCLLCLFCSRHSSPRSSLVFLFVCFIVFPSLYREQRWETQIVKCHRPWTVWTRGGCSALPPKEPKQYPHSQPLRVHLQHNGFKAIFKSLYFHSHCIVFKPNHKLWVLPDDFTCFLYCNFILFYFFTMKWHINYMRVCVALLKKQILCIVKEFLSLCQRYFTVLSSTEYLAVCVFKSFHCGLVRLEGLLTQHSENNYKRTVRNKCDQDLYYTPICWDSDTGTAARRVSQTSGNDKIHIVLWIPSLLSLVASRVSFFSFLHWQPNKKKNNFLVHPPF